MTEALDIYSLIGFVGTACIIGAYAYAVGPHMPQPSELNMFPHIKTDADGRPYIDWGANDLH